MSGEKGKKNLPSRFSSALAAILAVLLSVTLMMTIVFAGALYSLETGEPYTSAALSGEAMDLQMERIRENVTAIGAEYGFDPEPLIRAISRESVEEMNRQAVRWWNGFAASGELVDRPEYTMEAAEELLRADEAFMTSLDPMMTRTTLQAVERTICEKVTKSSVLFRDVLLRAGLSMAGKNLNLQELTAAVNILPGIFGAASLLLAGLIALLMSRRILTAGKYLGGAVSASGLLCLAALWLLRRLNLGGMIGEASEILAAQFAAFSHSVLMAALIAAAALLVIGGLLMAAARKEYARNE